MGINLTKQLNEAWDQRQIGVLHSDVVTDFLRCDSVHSRKAAVEYVKVLNHIGLDEENYPFFMEFFLHEDNEVIQALLGDGKVFDSLLKLQRSTQLIELCFELLRQFTLAGTYEKTLETLFTILKKNYRNPNSGYWIFPLTNQHLNFMGKFLDKGKPQTYRLNRLILDILGDLGDINSKDHIDSEFLGISTRANKIRNVFFDERVSMQAIIPEELLV